tara:strand:- start:79 stop:843 length:765 start_codon:yes stop_codon:yes gene_type:complete
MSKQLTKIVLAILVFTSSSLTLADHHAAPQTAALEAVFCSFEKGKDMDDLLKVTAEWDKWIDSSDSKAYAAYVMQPVINTGADFPYDYFWLGVAKNHEALGQSADEWMKKGGKIAAKFDAVAPCDTHILMTSQVIKPGNNDGKGGFAQISSCELKDGANMMSLMAADKQWVSWMTDNEMPGGLVRWYGGVGEAKDSTTDFYSVYLAESLAQRGKAHDMMMAGGGAALNSIYEDVMTCDVPRVYHGTPVGGKSAG